jgi:hypothetical protein
MLAYHENHQAVVDVGGADKSDERVQCIGRRLSKQLPMPRHGAMLRHPAGGSRHLIRPRSETPLLTPTSHRRGAHTTLDLAAMASREPMWFCYEVRAGCSCMHREITALAQCNAEMRPLMVGEYVSIEFAVLTSSRHRTRTARRATALLSRRLLA